MPEGEQYSHCFGAAVSSRPRGFTRGSYITRNDAVEDSQACSIGENNILHSTSVGSTARECINTEKITQESLHAAPASKAMPDLLRKVLSFPSLNPVQSSCFEAFSSQGNLVVSAPTGSGKTAIFEMAICREIERGLSLNKNILPAGPCLAGKVIYLAPIKALCSEKAVEWSKKFTPYNIRVIQVTGDEPLAVSNLSQLSKYDIILSTPEKFDSVTRQHKGPNTHSLACTVSLILIDEVHHLSDPRGAALEAVVTRMMLTQDELQCSSNESLRRLPGSSLRIVAASGTIPNIEDVGKWLRVDKTMCKTFSQSFRPVPLDVKVLGYKAKNKWKFDYYLQERLFQVIETYSNGGQTLVFCPTKKSCCSSALAFAQNFRQQNTMGVKESRASFASVRKTLPEGFLKSATTSLDKQGKDLLLHGAAVHHGDMQPEHRKLVEDLFRANVVKVLFATTTLAQGVNLPARLCVVKGTAIYQNGSMHEYDRNLIMQMLGRAGRPQYDNRGIAVIMTESAMVNTYTSICQGKHEVVESKLENKLPEHINAEISRLVITDMFSAITWLKCTFYYIRKRQLWRESVEKLEHLIHDLVANILRELSSYDIIYFDDNNFGVHPQIGCNIMSQYYLSLDTMKLFVQEADRITSPVEALKLLCKAKEFTDEVYVRRSEKKYLNDLNESLRYPLKSKVKLAQDKIYILLQASLADAENTDIGDWGLKRETLKMSQVSCRVAKSICQYLLERRGTSSFTGTHATLEIYRSLRNRVFWDGPGVIRQVQGIGNVFARKLIGGGAISIRKLASMDPRMIETLLSKNPPFGNEILSRLSTIPCLVGKIIRKTAADCNNAQILASFRIHVELCNWKIEDVDKNKYDTCMTNTLEFPPNGNGFLLVGCHSQNIIFYESFSLKSLIRDGKIYNVVIPKEASKGASSEWVDVLTGPHDFCGADFHKRIPIYNRNSALHRPLPVDELTDSVVNVTATTPHTTCCNETPLNNADDVKPSKHFGDTSPSHPQPLCGTCGVGPNFRKDYELEPAKDRHSSLQRNGEMLPQKRRRDMVDRWAGGSSIPRANAIPNVQSDTVPDTMLQSTSRMNDEIVSLLSASPGITCDEDGLSCTVPGSLDNNTHSLEGYEQIFHLLASVENTNGTESGLMSSNIAGEQTL